ncbi:unnamed protein product [Prorocentrum cordatum]|uniref:DUF7630 domain-containing protein n=1 Tax=Prorocentrum cordatum TaxID=2364126 RepID=A0ABN9W3M4_9DINO|nr:unnamed protein product [Polarella glacialis]
MATGQAPSWPTPPCSPRAPRELLGLLLWLCQARAVGPDPQTEAYATFLEGVLQIEQGVGRGPPRPSRPLPQGLALSKYGDGVWQVRVGEHDVVLAHAEVIGAAGGSVLEGGAWTAGGRGARAVFRELRLRGGDELLVLVGARGGDGEGARAGAGGGGASQILRLSAGGERCDLVIAAGGGGAVLASEGGSAVGRAGCPTAGVEGPLTGEELPDGHGGSGQEGGGAGGGGLASAGRGAPGAGGGRLLDCRRARLYYGGAAGGSPVPRLVEGAACGRAVVGAVERTSTSGECKCSDAGHVLVPARGAQSGGRSGCPAAGRRYFPAEPAADVEGCKCGSLEHIGRLGDSKAACGRAVTGAMERSSNSSECKCSGASHVLVPARSAQPGGRSGCLVAGRRYFPAEAGAGVEGCECGELEQLGGLGDADAGSASGGFGGGGAGGLTKEGWTGRAGGGGGGGGYCGGDGGDRSARSGSAGTSFASSSLETRVDWDTAVGTSGGLVRVVFRCVPGYERNRGIGISSGLASMCKQCEKYHYSTDGWACLFCQGVTDVTVGATTCSTTGEKLCPRGYENQNGTCGPCSIGWFSDDDSLRCKSCKDPAVVVSRSPENLTTLTKGSTSSTECVCDIATVYDQDKRRCIACPDGLDCSRKNLSLSAVSSMPGYYRHDGMQLSGPRPCPNAKACLGDQRCAPLHEGPLCAVCSAGAFTSFSGLDCVECDREERILSIVYVLLALGAVVGFALAVAAATRGRWSAMVARYSHHSRFSKQLVIVLVLYCQLLSTATVLLRFEHPEQQSRDETLEMLMVEFTEWFSAVMSLDTGALRSYLSAVRPECWLPSMTGLHLQVLVPVGTPLVLWLLVPCAACLLQLLPDGARNYRSRRGLAAFALACLEITLVGILRPISGNLSCDTEGFAGDGFLFVDYGFQCEQRVPGNFKDGAGEVTASYHLLRIAGPCAIGLHLLCVGVMMTALFQSYRNEIRRHSALVSRADLIEEPEDLLTRRRARATVKSSQFKVFPSDSRKAFEYAAVSLDHRGLHSRPGLQRRRRAEQH